MTQSIRRKGTVSATDLATRWRIGLETAKRTIACTMQLGVHDFSLTTARRRLRNVNQQLKYRRFH
jgi:hypothetical protein